MARPKSPLISKREVVRTALAILDAEGMHALSIRRLGAELKVNGASLYHHFSNKDEILSAVGRAVLAEMEVPEVGDDGFAWIVQMAKSQREVLLRHPEVIPLLSRGYLRTAALPVYELSRRILADAGIPRKDQLAILDAVEAQVVGSAVVMLMPSEPQPTPTAARLTAPASGNGRTTPRRAEEIFEASVHALLDTLRERYGKVADRA